MNLNKCIRIHVSEAQLNIVGKSLLCFTFLEIRSNSSQVDYIDLYEEVVDEAPDSTIAGIYTFKEFIKFCRKSTFSQTPCWRYNCEFAFTRDGIIIQGYRFIWWNGRKG